MLEDILSMRPTASFYQSESVVYDLMRARDMRYYTSESYQEVDKLIERFLKYHAKVIGPFKRPIYSSVPAQVLYWSRNDHEEEHKGGLYTNGAVLVDAYPDREVRSLFLNDADGIRWGYPSGYDLPALLE